MNTKLALEVIRVIRAEQNVRFSRLPEGDDDAASEQWHFQDVPFINELCVMLLVAIRHDVERGLVRLSAQVTRDGRELLRKEYEQRVRSKREMIRKKGLKSLFGELELDSFVEWNRSMETLRLLANSYKHDPFGTPDRDLLEHLELNPDSNYAPIPESPDLLKSLADKLDLEGEADFTEIAEELVTQADRFLTNVGRQAALSTVRSGPISFKYEDLAG